MARIIASILILFSAHIIYAQRVISRQEIDSVLNPKLLNGGEQVLRCDSNEVNIGTLSEDDAPSTCHFAFRNISSRPVTITRVKTSCGCTVAKLHSQTIAPGKEGKITVTFHPNGQVGQLYNRAFVYTNLSDSYPVMCLAITGNVKPSSDQWRDYSNTMGSLRLRYTTVYFSEVPLNLSPSERIECANSGSTPLKLSVLNGMLPTYMKFRTEPEVIPPGEKGEIVVTVQGKILPRDKKQLRFSLILEGLKVPPSQRTLDVKINTVSQ